MCVASLAARHFSFLTFAGVSLFESRGHVVSKKRCVCVSFLASERMSDGRMFYDFANL